MATPERTPLQRAEPKAIEPRCWFCEKPHSHTECPWLLPMARRGPRPPNGMCRHCGERLRESETFYHEECDPVNDSDLRADD
jgi:hypothetical protein